MNVEPIQPAQIPLDGSAGWNSPEPYPTPFHQPAFLEVLERHSGTELHLLAGHDEFGPVGLFPIFERTVGPITTVFSPPPEMGMYQLGPMTLKDRPEPMTLKDRPEPMTLKDRPEPMTLKDRPEPMTLDDGSLDHARRETRNCEFVEACLEWVSEELDPSYLHVRTHSGYVDARPFRWNGCELHSRFTYSVDLTRRSEEVLMAFSADARRNIRECEDACTVRVGGVEAIEWTLARVEQRYAAQGESFSVDPAFVTDLYETLPDGQVRPYVCEIEGERRGGMVVFEFGDTSYRWQGGVKTEAELPVNDFLDWRIMQDARERGVERYDLVGANTARLCEYKSKFDPELVHYCAAVGGTRLMRTVANFLGSSTGALGEKLKPLP